MRSKFGQAYDDYQRTFGDGFEVVNRREFRLRCDSITLRQ